MPRVEFDPNREDRITYEVYMDAYTDEEQDICWYYYLEQHLQFPFTARWVTNRSDSGKGEDVKVIGMADEDECHGVNVQVEILYREGEAEDTFFVPLSELIPTTADQETCEAVSDLHYWIDRGHEF